jgi:hypothetical protein
VKFPYPKTRIEKGKGGHLWNLMSQYWIFDQLSLHTSEGYHCSVLCNMQIGPYNTFAVLQFYIASCSCSRVESYEDDWVRVAVFFQGWGDNGKRAAATRRPSSARRLYVEQAFLCHAIWETTINLMMVETPTVSMTSSCIPSFLRHSRRTDGGCTRVFPVPNTNISIQPCQNALTLVRTEHSTYQASE